MSASSAEPLFARREEAGAALAEQIGVASFTKTSLLALSPGGVAVALGIAKSIGAPIDLLGVTIVGLTGDTADAVGSVSEDGAAVFDPSFAPSFDTLDDLEAATDWARFRVRQIVATVRPDRNVISLEDRQVLLVDDIVRTIWPVIAGLEFADRRGAARTAVAAAAATEGPYERLHLRNVELFCLNRIEPGVDSMACFREGKAPSLDRVPGLIESASAS